MTTARTHSATTYGAYSLVPNLVPSIIPETVKRLYPQAVRAAALVYLDAGAAQTNGESFKVAWSKVGFNFVYDHSLEVTDLSYDAYVNAMYDKHVTYIMYTGAYQNGIRLARSIAVKKAADPTWKPVFQMDSVAYDAGFVGSGGPAIADTLAYTASGLNEAPTPELSLYSQWLSRVSPGSTPTYFGQFAWSAARLFTDEALALGGKLNRQSLLNAVRTVHAWTGHGMHATMDVGSRISPRCTAILQLRNGVWVNVGGGRPYVCGTLINTGVGAG